MKGRVWPLLALFAVPALGSLLLIPIESLVHGSRLPWFVLRALTLVQPAFLMALAIGVGCLLAPRCNLEAPILSAISDRSFHWTLLRGRMTPAVAGGLFGALCIGVYGLITTHLSAIPPHTPGVPLLTGLLYGGIGEEILMRWGLMTLCVWIGQRLAGEARPSVYLGAIAISAFLFGLGHLPFLHALVPHASMGLVALVIAANAMPGCVFGWLFWKHGLESAMMAHAIAHLAVFGLMAVIAS